jgi:hypothetical protein
MRQRRKYPWSSRGMARSAGWAATGAVTVGFVGGLVVGALVWSVQMRRCQRDLFSSNRFRRLAALGYLGGRPGVDTARLLTDYLRWETHPALRLRGERLLRRMKVYLE